jgi:hypothetical protein
MTAVSHPEVNSSSDRGDGLSSPCSCDLHDRIRCWSRYVRELRADLATARGHPDDEVLAFDLCVAEAQLTVLLAIAPSERRAA